MESAFWQLEIILLLSLIWGIVVKLFKLPLILAYLIAGAGIGLMGINNGNYHETLGLFSDLGVMLLLFLVGLEINFSALKSIGKKAIGIGIGQIVFCVGAAYLIGWGLGLRGWTNFYLACGLTFSSTIVVVKLLSEKKDLNSLHGKIALAILLVQDITAIGLLLFVGGMRTATADEEAVVLFIQLLLLLIKSGLIVGLTAFLSKKVMPVVLGLLAAESELLFLGSLTWFFISVWLAQLIGLPAQIGGLLAGLALANSQEHYQIAARMRPLRDFFLMVYFVLLGTGIKPGDYSGQLSLLAAALIIVVLLKPLLVMALSRLAGYQKRVSFLTALSLGQISEFSLILIAAGKGMGQIAFDHLNIIGGVFILSVASSSVLIHFDNRVYLGLRRWWPLDSKKGEKEADEDGIKELTGRPIVLVGFHRLGQSIVYHLAKNKLLVIDYDPDMTSKLKAEGYHYLFGDAADPEIIEQANLKHSRLLISTCTDTQDSLALLTAAKNINPQLKVILRAEDENQVQQYYNRGADYVILPHFDSGLHLGQLIENHPDLESLASWKTKDLRIINSL